MSYPVGRSLWYGLFLLGAWVLAALACGWWAWSAREPVRPAVGLLVLGAAGAWAAHAWRSQASGLLAWDGAHWSWAAASDPNVHGGTVEPRLDLQQVLLLRWGGDGGAWFWLERRMLPARWDALRRAVYSPAASTAVRGAEPPTAPP